MRLGKEHNFDIVEGPMADDQIWDYVEDYMADNISKSAFWNWLSLNIQHIRLYFAQKML